LKSLIRDGDTSPVLAPNKHTEFGYEDRSILRAMHKEG